MLRKIRHPGLDRSWLIIIATILGIALVLIPGLKSFEATEQTGIDEFSKRQQVGAREVTHQIERHFQDAAKAMRSLGELPEIQLFYEYQTRKTLYQRFREIAHLGVGDIGVLDADGIMRYSHAAQHMEGADLSGQTYFQEASEMTSNDSFVMEYVQLVGPDGTHKGILLAVPMFESVVDNRDAVPSGEFAGLVACTLRLEAVTEAFMAPLSSSEMGRAFLIDDENTVLWAPSKSLVGKNLLDVTEGFPQFKDVVERMTSGESGVGEYSYYRFDEASREFGTAEEEMLIAYAPVSLGEELWSIGLWAPREEALNLIRTPFFGQVAVVVLGLVAIILGCTFALFTSYRHGKNLKRQVEAKTGELKESHARLLTVLDSLDASVYVADMQTYEILFVNKHLRDFLGDVLGQTCWEVLHAGQSEPCPFCKNARLLTDEGELADVYRWEFQDPATGSWYDIRDRAIEWVDGRIVRVEIAVDITKRKQAEEALQQAHDELEKRVEERTADIAKANAALERSNKDLEQFAYIASHDLQEPLRMVASYTQLLADRYKGQLDDKADLFIHYAVDGAVRMQTLIDDLLTFSRVTTKGKPLEPCDCKAAFDQAITNLGMAIQEKDALVTSDDLPTVLADNTQLVQLLQNLIGNAIKFHSDERPQVHVSAKQEDGKWVLSVRDNGIGFEPEYAERIFQMFQRLNKRGERPGTGIGLAVCKRIVERHNGRIWVESEPGSGSTFNFALQHVEAREGHQSEEEGDDWN